eukprot:SAG22_NODE_1046_length_5865_cov_4.719910_2_plen_175_part_00
MVLSFKGSDHCLSFCFSAFLCGSTALTSDRCNQLPPDDPLATLQLNKLSAPGILRMSKVVNYVETKLQEAIKASSKSQPGTPGTSIPKKVAAAAEEEGSSGGGGGGGGGGDADAGSAAAAADNDAAATAAATAVEIVCKTELLPVQMNLRSVQRFIWRQPEDVILHFRYKQSEA